jgi:hypothetical protein
MSHETRDSIAKRIEAIQQVITKLQEDLNVNPSEDIHRALLTAKRRRTSLRGVLAKFDARTKNE